VLCVVGFESRFVVSLLLDVDIDRIVFTRIFV